MASRQKDTAPVALEVHQELYILVYARMLYLPLLSDTPSDFEVGNAEVHVSVGFHEYHAR
jgi:hypothetical protein